MQKFLSFMKHNGVVLFAVVAVAGIMWLGARTGSPRRLQTGTAQSPEASPAGQIVQVDIQGKPFIGSASAPVTFVEYGDYQCPFCQQFQETVFGQLKQKYIDTGKVKFVWGDYVLFSAEHFGSGISDPNDSTLAAEAAHCAQDQGKFWEYHDVLFRAHLKEFQPDVTVASLAELGKNVGLDTQALTKCVNAGTYAQYLADATSEAETYGVQATPTSFVNGVKVEGVQPFATYASLIDSMLQ